MVRKTIAAKTAKADSVPLKLKGKTVAFAGKFSYLSGEQAFGWIIKVEGGKVAADVTAKLDYLVVGHARGRTAVEKQAERLKKQGAAIQILDETAFRQLFALTRDEAMALLRGGEQGVARWNMLWSFFPVSRARIDLRGIDLRGANLRG
jgi:BRCT domain type II-containing protein